MGGKGFVFKQFRRTIKVIFQNCAALQLRWLDFRYAPVFEGNDCGKMQWRNDLNSFHCITKKGKTFKNIACSQQNCWELPCSVSVFFLVLCTVAFTSSSANQCNIITSTWKYAPYYITACYCLMQNTKFRNFYLNLVAFHILIRNKGVKFLEIWAWNFFLGSQVIFLQNMLFFSIRKKCRQQYNVITAQ